MKTWSELAIENTRMREKFLQIEADFQAQLLQKDAAIQSKSSIIQSKSSIIKSKDAFIEELKEALILARNRQFAKTSESSRSLQSELFNEAEMEASIIQSPADDEQASISVAAHKRQCTGRKPLPADLPRIDVIHDLSDAQKICPHDAHRLQPIGDKVSEQLDIVPMQLRVIRHIRKQYACPCCEGFIKIADKPKQAIEKSQASAGLLSYITVSKYADALPLYRQSQILSRFDIEMNRSTLANWMIRCGQLVQPLINRIEEQLLDEAIIHMDESPVQVLNEAGKTAPSKSYMWLRCAGPPGRRLILFDYDASRSGAVPQRLLADYTGALMVDGYEAYEAVCREQSLKRLGCWVHARRRFVEVSKTSKKNNPHAVYALKLMARLYAIESSIKQAHPDQRYQIRMEQSKPVIDKLKTWLDETQPKVAPKTTLGKALHYLQNQWPRLIGYLEDGRYPMDNNVAENAIRPFAIGRKNWLFSASVAGAKASANLYSLVETAKANNIPPYDYLKKVFTDLPNATSFDDVDKLLPANISKTR